MGNVDKWILGEDGDLIRVFQAITWFCYVVLQRKQAGSGHIFRRELVRGKTVSQKDLET